VRTDKGEVVITGRRLLLLPHLARARLPRFVYDREQMLASLDRWSAWRRAARTLFFGHDPDFWKDVPQAPVPAF
jgi:hypothetical protein